MSYSLKPDSIILFDSSSSLDELKKFTQKGKPTIITFDYESHMLLSQNNISHEISDSYIDENDLQTIQKQSYHFAEWFREQPINSLVDYEGINLGELFHVEFHYLLIPFLKKFVEVSKIITKFNNTKFVAQNTLYRIISHFSPSAEQLGKNKDTASDFIYDIVNIHIKIRNASFTIVLSKSFYAKLKKISEKFIKFLLNKPKRLSNDKTVLLVEFDAMRYKTIFSLSSESPLNLVFFYRRRPPIWNLKSYSIIKNSRSILATYYSLVDKHLKGVIKNKVSLAESMINSLTSKESFLKAFFSINGISFWEVLKPFFVQLCTKRMMEGIEETEITKKLFENYRFSSVLLLNENSFNELIIIKLAKKYKIPITLIQHGLYYDTTEAYELNKLLGIFPNYSDKFIAWGNVLEHYAVNCGIPLQKIKVLGNPSYDDLFQNQLVHSTKSGGFVLLTITAPEQIWVSELTVETRKNYENAIISVYETVSKINKKLVIKLHPSQKDIGITKFNENYPKMQIIKGENILSLIEACDVLVSFDLSTTILLAQILKKPTISITMNYAGLGESEIFKSKSSSMINLDEFEITLNRILEDEHYRQEIIEKGTKFVDDYLVNQGSASEELLSFLKGN